MGTDTRRSATGGDPADDESRMLTRRELHGRERPHWRRSLVIGLVAVLVVLGGGAAFVAWRLNANITKIDVSEAIGTDRPEEVAGTTDAVNLLLIGSDTREGDGNDAYADNDGTTGEAHSDTNLLVHVSADRTWATVVSIPRDSMTPAPPDCSATAPKEQWRMRMWNQNYRIGGTGCLIRTVEGNTGLRIDHYAVVDFRGFKTMVDALGGVDVCTSEPIDDANTHLVLAAGRHTLDGRQALQYVRVRKSIGDGSDLGRIQRQQAFLSSVMQEATSTKLLFQPSRLFSFLDAATKSLTTDPDFGLGTMQDLATSVRGIGLDEIQFVTVPNETYPLDTNRVQWKDSAKTIWKALREDQQLGVPAKTASPTPTPSAEPLTASPDEISVRVVNSSGVPGLARQARDALQVQGFVGVTTSDGTPGPTGALVEYSGDRAEEARTVAAAFPGATVEKVSGLGSTVRVTLGEGAPTVAELPNRLGDEPLPTPSVEATPSPGESIPTRTATTDICS
ncbi:LCP family protein [Oryzobacter terrae]|uniref:LCP family protein n=1 Tax=Oryzobacter terrae TaxID=1620385 RepID=UPI003671F1D4